MPCLPGPRRDRGRALLLLLACALPLGCAGSRSALRPALRARAERVVLGSLESPDRGEREAAIRVIAALADPRLDQAALPLLSDADALVRTVAALVLTPRPEARAVLVASIAGADPAARAAATEGLGSLPRGGALLVGLVRDRDPAVRTRAAAALASLRPPGALEAALQLSHDPDPGVRAMAWYGLGALGGTGLVDQTARGLADPVLSVRLAALAALERLQPALGPFEALAARRQDPFVALRAAGVLARRGSTRLASQAVRAGASDPRVEVRIAAMLAAGGLGEQARSILMPSLKDPARGVQLAAARALVATGQAELARPALEAGLATPRALDAAETLLRLGDLRVLSALAALADAVDPQERAHVLRLIAPLAAAQPLLQRGLDDRDPGVRLAAAEALLRKATRPQLAAR